jgi:hypothetical protein
MTIIVLSTASGARGISSADIFCQFPRILFTSAELLALNMGFLSVGFLYQYGVLFHRLPVILNGQFQNNATVFLDCVFLFVYYLMTLSVSTLYSLDDVLINECEAVGGMRMKLSMIGYALLEFLLLFKDIQRAQNVYTF